MGEEVKKVELTKEEIDFINYLIENTPISGTKKTIPSILLLMDNIQVKLNG